MLLLLAALIAGGAWFGLSGGTGESDDLLNTEVVAGGNSDIVATLLALRSVSLDSSIFSDPSFTTLRDFGTQILPEPVGRTNPFAPLSETATSSSSPASTRAFDAR